MGQSHLVMSSRNKNFKSIGNCILCAIVLSFSVLKRKSLHAWPFRWAAVCEYDRDRGLAGGRLGALQMMVWLWLLKVKLFRTRYHDHHTLHRNVIPTYSVCSAGGCGNVGHVVGEA